MAATTGAVKTEPALKLKFLSHGTLECRDIDFTRQFYWDADDNCWEILSNPDGGYTWLFERGDQEGIGHMTKKYDRPTSTRS